MNRKREKDKTFKNFKERIKKVLRRIALAGIMSTTISTSYPAYMYSPKYNFPQYKYEMSLIEKGDEYCKVSSVDNCEKSYECYRKAMESMKKKQEKIGEGIDMELDFFTAYTIYTMARTPPQPEYAEKYLLEAREFVKKYYEIWKDDAFLDFNAVILENLGYIYFNTAELVRNGEVCILLLKVPIPASYAPHGLMDRIIVANNPFTIHYYSERYLPIKVINSENFIEILYYYEIAKKWYEEYLKFYKESNIEEKIKDYPKIVRSYKERNERVLSHLKIIDEILSKYKPDYKREEKEAVEKKEEIEKEEKKTKEKEQEKINWDEIKDKDVQDGL